MASLTIRNDYFHYFLLYRKMKTRYFYVYKLQRLPGVGDPTAKEFVVISSDIRNPLLSDAAGSGKKINVKELDR